MPTRTAYPAMPKPPLYGGAIHRSAGPHLTQADRALHDLAGLSPTLHLSPKSHLAGQPQALGDCLTAHRFVDGSVVVVCQNRAIPTAFIAPDARAAGPILAELRPFWERVAKGPWFCTPQNADTTWSEHTIAPVWWGYQTRDVPRDHAAHNARIEDVVTAVGATKVMGADLYAGVIDIDGRLVAPHWTFDCRVPQHAARITAVLALLCPHKLFGGPLLSRQIFESSHCDDRSITGHQGLETQARRIIGRLISPKPTTHHAKLRALAALFPLARKGVSLSDLSKAAGAPG